MEIQVKCITARSNKLIKNGIYTVLDLRLYSYRADKFANIKGVGWYNAKNFVTFDGKPLNEIQDFSSGGKRISPKDIDYSGQFVRSRSSNCKSLKEGEIYYVEKQYKINDRYSNYKLKIKGIKNTLSHYNFEEISQSEQRFIKLKKLRGQEIKTGDQTRKFLLYSEKERITIFFEVLSRCLADINKTNISEAGIDIVNLIVKKGYKYDISREDVELLMKENIGNIIKRFV